MAGAHLPCYSYKYSFSQSMILTVSNYHFSNPVIAHCYIFFYLSYSVTLQPAASFVTHYEPGRRNGHTQLVYYIWVFTHMARNDQRAKGSWIRILRTNRTGTPSSYEHLRKGFHERGSWGKIFVLSIQTLYSAIDRNDEQASKIWI